jgi:hypothetical protein
MGLNLGGEWQGIIPFLGCSGSDKLVLHVVSAASSLVRVRRPLLGHELLLRLD